MEIDEIASGRLCADLALVQSGILHLGGAKLERPFARVPLVVDGEAPVLGVDRSADAQDVQVAVADPRHLHRPLWYRIRWLVGLN